MSIIGSLMGHDRFRTYSQEGTLRFRWTGGTAIHVDVRATNHAGIATWSPMGVTIPIPAGTTMTGAVFLGLVADWQQT